MSIGTLASFDPRTQEWEIFRNRVKQFLSLNDIRTEEKKRAVLITHLSDEAYLLIRNLSHPKEVENSTFDELVELLNKHLTPTRATFADLANFYNAVQEEETVEDWAARLRGLAVHCAFGDSLDKVYRDKFVLGLKVGPVRNRLCEEDATTLTYGKALEIAKNLTAREPKIPMPRTLTTFTGKKEERVVKNWSDVTGTKQKKKNPRDRCAVHGMKGHTENTCYQVYSGQRFNGKSSFKKIYDAKVKTVKSSNRDMSAASEKATPKKCRKCEEYQLLNLRWVSTMPIL